MKEERQTGRTYVPACLAVRKRRVRLSLGVSEALTVKASLWHSSIMGKNLN